MLKMLDSPQPPWQPGRLSAFTCARLSDACLTLHEPSPSCSSSCAKSDRPFRIDGHGHNAEAEINAAVGALRHLADPFDSFKLRHLERDLFAMQRITAKRRRQLHRARAAGEELTMIWPNWEAGFVRRSVHVDGNSTRVRDGARSAAQQHARIISPAVRAAASDSPSLHV